MSDKDRRTERRNLDLPVHLVEATSAEACEVASRVVLALALLAVVATVTRWEVVQEAVADSSTSPTFVPFRRH